MNYAIIDEDNRVINVIVWDGQNNYTLLQGLQLIPSDSVGIGMIYDPVTEAFSAPAE